MTAWVTTAEAAELLCLSESALSSRRLRSSIRNRCFAGRAGVPRVWYKPDVERAAEIRREAGTGIAAATRIAAALREGRVRA